MNRTLVVISALFAFSLAFGRGPASSTSNSAPATKAVDACALLTSADIQAVQGEAVKQATPATPSASGMTLSACLFTTPTPSKSVSLLLALPTPDDKSSVRKFWQQQFSQGGDAAHRREVSGGRNAQEAAQEEELRQPHSVKGIGDQAYWTSNGRTSALYVLTGDRFLRISVGGVRDEHARLQRSKALARAATKRMAQH